MVTDYDCWHSDHDEVDVSMVIQTLQKNASNAQNMIKEVIKTFKDFSVENDPANNCLDVAIITDPKLRTKKTIKKLENIAGRVLQKFTSSSTIAFASSSANFKISLLLTPNNLFIMRSIAHFKFIAVGLEAIKSSLVFFKNDKSFFSIIDKIKP